MTVNIVLEPCYLFIYGCCLINFFGICEVTSTITFFIMPIYAIYHCLNFTNGQHINVFTACVLWSNGIKNMLKFLSLIYDLVSYIWYIYHILNEFC